MFRLKKHILSVKVSFLQFRTLTVPYLAFYYVDLYEFIKRLEPSNIRITIENYS